MERARAATDEAGSAARRGHRDGRITKTWEGLARTLFTTGDSDVDHLHDRLPDPLAGLALASALTVSPSSPTSSR